MITRGAEPESMLESDVADQLQAQIDSQVIQRAAYQQKIDALTGDLAQLMGPVNEKQDEIDGLKKDFDKLRAVIESEAVLLSELKSPLQEVISKLQALQSNADALDRAILGCKVMLE